MTESSAKLFDVIAVNTLSGARRPLAIEKTERNADAIITMAVARRGVDEEFYITKPASAEMKAAFQAAHGEAA